MVKKLFLFATLAGLLGSRHACAMHPGLLMVAPLAILNYATGASANGAVGRRAVEKMPDDTALACLGVFCAAVAGACICVQQDCCGRGAERLGQLFGLSHPEAPAAGIAMGSRLALTVDTHARTAAVGANEQKKDK